MINSYLLVENYDIEYVVKSLYWLKFIPLLSLLWKESRKNGFVSPTTTGLLIFICSFFDLQDLLSVKLLATPYSYNIPLWQD